MLLSDQQLVKEDIVKTIAQAVKHLQEECISQTNSLQMASSDNAPTQIFTAALEAAFIHGLKKGNYEKQKPHTNMPRPHFWNLIRRISHSDAIAEIKKMKCIDSRVGESRAWLRWILNESVITSYLSSFILNKEYTSILSHYYEAYALFRDDEQSDLLMRYLQGAESLCFQLTCNSSVLNDWTKTPLQYAGFFAPSAIRRTSSYLHISPSPAQGMRHSSSFNHSSEFVRFPPSRHCSFSQSNNMSISPASSVGSQRSNPSYIRVLATSVEEAHHKNLVEILPSAGQAFPTLNGQEDGEVLHKRLVKRRKRNRPKRKQVEDYTSCGTDSHTGSLSSIFGSESTLSSSRVEGSDPSVSRTSSRSSSNTTSPLLQHVPVQTDFKSSEINLKRSGEASTPARCCANDKRVTCCDGQSAFHSTDKITTNQLSSPTSDTNSTLDAIEETSEVVGLLLSQSEVLGGCRGNLPSRQSLISDQDTSDTAQTRANPASFPPQSTAAIQCVEPEKTCREGFLQKKGDTLRIWRTRWFTLGDGILSYYKSRKCKEKLGTIYLSEVETIDEEEIAKTKGICLKMESGIEHQLAADSKSVMSSWVNDIKKAMEECVRSNDLEDNSETIESGFEALERYNIDEDGPSDTHGNNNDFLERMRKHMVEVADETTLEAQNHKCADCSSSIGLSSTDQRLCCFTGKYCCPKCHHNDEHPLPAKMISSWDFEKYSVSRKSKNYLERVWKEPWIEMNTIHPSVHKHRSEMQLVLSLRTKLISIHRYISTCRIIPVGLFNSKLKGHNYMVEHPHMISAHDLHKVQGGGLADVMSMAVTFGAEHIRSCQLCSVKGFVCEICQKDEIIFPFETKKAKECGKCQGVYHKECFDQVAQCPKCDRRERRIKKLAEDEDN